jgi:hypothetical protein
MAQGSIIAYICSAVKGGIVMASKRCLPTRFFKDADIMNVSKDGQLILVGLVLLADDEGRELAHPRLLSREIDYPPEQIESALQELVENDLVVLYQAGKHRYYSLTRWSQWQSISSQKMVPSKYPAPPEAGTVAEPVALPASEADRHDPRGPGDAAQKSPEIPRNPQRNAGENRESPTQLNLSESNSSQCNSIEDEGEMQPPPNVVSFPNARDDADDLDRKNAERDVIGATKQVAAILNIPMTEGLQRVVADYLGDTSLSLLGEADAAREWIEDPRRNLKRKQLTPAFFRCWLKREHETARRGYGSGGTIVQQTADGISPIFVRSTRLPANGTGPPGAADSGATEHAENPYQAYVNARAKAVMCRVLNKQEEMRHEASS